MSLTLAERLLSGDRRALSRALTLVENRQPGYEELLRKLAQKVGQARRIGITGPPGVGKSTLATALACEWRRLGESVGVLAIDPSSRATGGALLGDRIRMAALSGDPKAFIRSAACREGTGAIADASGDLLDVLDAAGFSRLILETVGAGQSEGRVRDQVDIVLVVLGPGAGDGVQAMKAGILEIADFWVINKCDDPAAERVLSDLMNVLSISKGEDVLKERVRLVSASTGHGIPDLVQQIERLGSSSEFATNPAAEVEGRMVRRVLAIAASELASALQSEEALRERVRSATMGLVSAKTVALEVLSSAVLRLKASEGVKK